MRRSNNVLLLFASCDGLCQLTIGCSHRAAKTAVWVPSRNTQSSWSPRRRPRSRIVVRRREDRCDHQMEI